MVPVLVEALEAVGREADRGCGGKVEVARVEEVEEGVLQDFGPDFEVFEVCAAGLRFVLV
jgi:methylmalonyl-CoA mutase cobalamin-binding subunit